jgi:hypothetical protein
MRIDADQIYSTRAAQVAGLRGAPPGRHFTLSPEPRLADAIERLAERSGVTPDVVIEQACWRHPQIRREAGI